jgi:NAD(P)-dependent dehydrogenase (short-subunit alcohol dehydrogenase family)
MSEFENTVVLITGAGKGFGRTLAEAFAAQGARIAANDVTPINLDETIERIHATGGIAKPFIADVASKLAVQTMLNQVVESWGVVDILINHAAVDPRSSILTLDEWDWRRALDVNLTGAFFLMQSVARIMKESGKGIILNICSLIEQIQNVEKHAAYTASKTGLVGLTQAASQEFKAYNIRTNALIVNPGTDGMENAVNQALYLCSEAATEVNGQIAKAYDV